MSLATRCPSCETAFRVVQDQLKVSEGWVRCGQCSNVFSALEGLFDLDREGPPERPAASPPAVSPPAVSAPIVSASADDSDPYPYPDSDSDSEVGVALPIKEALDPPSGLETNALTSNELLPVAVAPAAAFRPDDDRIDEHLFGKPRPDAEKGQAMHVDARDRIDFSDARFDSDLFAESAVLPDEDAAHGAAGRLGEAPLESATQHQPGFMRRADRRGRWQGSPNRRALLADCLIGAAALALQIAHHDRDALASRWPSTLPALSNWCRVAGCAVSAPRRIDDVSVESTALTRATGRDAFVFSAVLRNRGATALAMPSIELSLTDGDGRLVARRALSPAELDASDRLAPGAEAALDVSLGTGSLRVSGYTAEIFYP